MLDIHKVARRAVKAILADLTDRGGFRQIWDELDDHIQLEIISVWRELVEKELDRDSNWTIIK